jgi:hypothetical protein
MLTAESSKNLFFASLTVLQIMLLSQICQIIRAKQLPQPSAKNGSVD